MVETPDGFVVAVPAEIVQADPKADPTGYSELRNTLIARSSAPTWSASSPMHCASAPSRASISSS